MSPGYDLPWTIFSIFVLNLSAPFIVQVFGVQLSILIILSATRPNPKLGRAQTVFQIPMFSPPSPRFTRDRVVVFTRGATIVFCSCNAVDIKGVRCQCSQDEGIIDMDGVGGASRVDYSVFWRSESHRTELLKLATL